jgi:hypothetical protein
VEEEGDGLDAGFEQTQRERHPQVSGYCIGHHGGNADVNEVVARRFFQCRQVLPDETGHGVFLCNGARPEGLDRNDLEICFGHAAVRALPALGHIGPKGSGGDAVFRATGSFVIHKAANDTDIGFHGVLGLDYVNKSKEIIESKIKNPHYFIFSDDVDWCIENLSSENSTIVSHEYKGEKFSHYLQLMSSCKNFIIPNSTFAWWAAFLSESNGKIVISPQKWFTNENINTNYYFLLIHFLQLSNVQHYLRKMLYF